MTKKALAPAGGSYTRASDGKLKKVASTKPRTDPKPKAPAKKDASNA